MIIITERKLNYKSDLRDPGEVQAFFDMIWKAFSDIDSALGQLTTIFIDLRWNLKEGLSDSLAAYTQAADKIRARLQELSMMNATLTNFLANETRPIPIRVTTSDEIDRRTNAIKEELKSYYKFIKGTSFPKFDNEIKQHQGIVKVINENIDRINEINSAYPRHRAVRHIRNL